MLSLLDLTFKNMINLSRKSENLSMEIDLIALVTCMQDLILTSQTTAAITSHLALFCPNKRLFMVLTKALTIDQERNLHNSRDKSPITKTLCLSFQILTPREA